MDSQLCQMDFTEWLFILMDELKKHGITQVDQATAEADYNRGYSPIQSAEYFVKEINNGL